MRLDCEVQSLRQYIDADRRRVLSAPGGAFGPPVPRHGGSTTATPVLPPLPRLRQPAPAVDPPAIMPARAHARTTRAVSFDPPATTMSVGHDAVRGSSAAPVLSAGAPVTTKALPSALQPATQATRLLAGSHVPEAASTSQDAPATASSTHQGARDHHRYTPGLTASATPSTQPDRPEEGGVGGRDVSPNASDVDHDGDSVMSNRGEEERQLEAPPDPFVHQTTHSRSPSRSRSATPTPPGVQSLKVTMEDDNMNGGGGPDAQHGGDDVGFGGDHDGHERALTTVAARARQGGWPVP